ncbi:lipocalin family protein [Microscilla marina]|nr:lipocalin family protein [Microscilla marina]
MKKIFLFSIIALVMVFTQACKKGGNDNPAPTPTPPGGGATNQNLLKTWKVSSVMEGNLDVTSEYSSYFLVLTESDGNKVFTLIDHQGNNTEGTWSITTDETTITLNETEGATTTLSAVSISASQLKYTTSETGKTGQVTLSFTLIPS